MKIFPSSIMKIKEEAFSRFQKEGLPGRKDEYWRKTDWHTYLEKRLVLGRADDFQLPAGASDYDFYLTGGRLHGKRKLIRMENGIIAGSLLEAARQYPALMEKYFHRIIKPKFKNLSGLNTILFQDGFFLYVPAGVRAEDSFRLFYLVSDAQKKTQFHHRNLIIIEDKASVNLEVYDSASAEADAFVTDLTEIHAGKESVLNLYRRQDLPESVSLVAMYFSVHQERSASDANLLTFNGEYVRNEVFSFLKGEESGVTWRGIYLPGAEQKTDNRIFMIHDAENTRSNQQFKGILQDASRSFFNGYILVKRGAQKTDAYQQNANILLSRRAKVYSYPFLEIYADDVSCSHGSTTGQLDDEALFYLQQRGIDETTARKMILRSFVAEVIDALPESGWREDAEKNLDRTWSSRSVVETV